MAIIVSDKLTLSSPSTKACCMDSAWFCACATPSSEDLSTPAKSTVPLAAGADRTSMPCAAAAAVRICANKPSTLLIPFISASFFQCWHDIRHADRGKPGKRGEIPVFSNDWNCARRR